MSISMQREPKDNIKIKDYWFRKYILDFGFTVTSIELKSHVALLHIQEGNQDCGYIMISYKPTKNRYNLFIENIDDENAAKHLKWIWDCNRKPKNFEENIIPVYVGVRI